MAITLRPMPEYVNKISGYNKTKTADGYTFDLAAAKRYYSSIDVELYIGNTYVDDAVTLQFSVQQNVGGMTGYNSYTVDEFVLGSRSIQGVFEVNFTSPNYLNKVLKVIADSKNKGYELSTYKVTRDDRDAAKITETTADAITVTSDKRSPIWKPSFTLDIMMGQKTKGLEPVHLIITEVQITALNMGMAPEGTAMTERYAFVGKDIKTIG